MQAFNLLLAFLCLAALASSAAARPVSGQGVGEDGKPIAAGVVATAAVTTDLPPAVRWTAAIVAGGGTAGIVQTLTSVARLKSTMVSGGLVNPVLATLEPLFGKGDRPSRLAGFAAAMGKLASDYPGDPDVAAFHRAAELGADR